MNQRIKPIFWLVTLTLLAVFTLLTSLSTAQTDRPVAQSPFPAGQPSLGGKPSDHRVGANAVIPIEKQSDAGSQLRRNSVNESMQAALARSPYTYGNRLPAGNFTLTYFGDSNSIDANPGDGICADPDGACGLRAAVMEANALDPGTFINIPADATITLTRAGVDENSAATGDLDITNSMTILGGSALTTIINGGGIDRVFDVWNGVVDIKNLSITGGDATLSANGFEELNGGAVWLNCTADLLLQDVNIYDNIAAQGAGVFVGYVCDDAVNLLYVVESAIFSNDASDAVGGLHGVQGADVELYNTTISSNTSLDFNAGLSIEDVDGFIPALIANNVTVADNRTTSEWGESAGIFAYGGTFDFNNSIAAYNNYGAGFIRNDCGVRADAFMLTDEDNVFVNIGTCVEGATDLVDPSLDLGVIVLNAPGTTHTNALPLGSSAIDWDFDACLPFDQRGVTRPQG
ncbi:MAG: hypothetical protein H7Y11_00245, partial [Armatimonadetes bacterium]|nr:hypothetical protein [Anaerolineae bacterium]